MILVRSLESDVCLWPQLAAAILDIEPFLERSVDTSADSGSWRLLYENGITAAPRRLVSDCLGQKGSAVKMQTRST
jgi:hypothetical protein